MIVYFKYGENVKAYNCLSLTSNIKSETINATTLRGSVSDKLKYARRIWKVSVDTRDLIADTDIEFFENFFLSDSRSISLNNTDFKAVTTSSGDFPLKYLEDCKFLPTIEFTLTAKYADKTKLTGELAIE